MLYTDALKYRNLSLFLQATAPLLAIRNKEYMEEI